MIDSNAETIALLRSLIEKLENGSLRVDRIKNEEDFDIKQMDGKDISSSIELSIHFRRAA